MQRSNLGKRRVGGVGGLGLGRQARKGECVGSDEGTRQGCRGSSVMARMGKTLQ